MFGMGELNSAMRGTLIQPIFYQQMYYAYLGLPDNQCIPMSERIRLCPSCMVIVVQSADYWRELFSPFMNAGCIPPPCGYTLQRSIRIP